MTVFEICKSQFIPVFVVIQEGRKFGYYRKRLLHGGYEKYRVECYIEYKKYFSIGFVDKNFEKIKSKEKDDVYRI
jgi:hypothetical protein